MRFNATSSLFATPLSARRLPGESLTAWGKRVRALNGKRADVDPGRSSDLPKSPKYAIPVAAPVTRSAQPILTDTGRETYDNAPPKSGTSYGFIPAGGPAPLLVDQAGPVTMPTDVAPPLADDAFSVAGVSISKRNAILGVAAIVALFLIFKRKG